jgi:hypothetical protein
MTSASEVTDSLGNVFEWTMIPFEVALIGFLICLSLVVLILPIVGLVVWIRKRMQRGVGKDEETGHELQTGLGYTHVADEWAEENQESLP